MAGKISNLDKFSYDVAIIMDGNGRWAQNRNRPRFWGHLRGASIVSKIVEEAVNLSLNSLTLFAFSTENWNRPDKEVSFLFNLLDKFLYKERLKIIENNIQFKIIGNYQFLDKETLLKVRKLEQETLNNSGLKLNFAFGYGGRQEIVHSVNQFIESNPNTEISEKDISEHLFNNDVSNIDLLIRTGGDQRISNFMLWQMSYAELFFTDTFWPDFNCAEFREILEKMGRRDRRFGCIKEIQNLNFSHMEL